MAAGRPRGEVHSMEHTFGARLRAQREQREIPLSRISHETKIKQSLLEALERDDVTYWPQGIFRRAYIRSYALAIGLDPEPVVREFLARYPDPAEQLPEPEPEPSGLQRAFAIAMMGGRPLPKPTRTELIARMTAAVAPGAAAKAPADVPAAAPAPVNESEPRTFEPPDLRTPEPSGVRPSGPPDLRTLSDLCTSIARAADWDDLNPALEQAAGVLGASGLTVWIFDGRFNALRPVWAHGYAEELVARMPRVRRDADNALATAARDERTCVVKGQDGSTGAIVVPMLTAGRCVGVVALELADGREGDELIQAMASILAAQLTSVTACYTEVSSESRAS
jgi:hypothetical protein